jgi:hypothetical protein
LLVRVVFSLFFCMAGSGWPSIQQYSLLWTGMHTKFGTLPAGRVALRRLSRAAAAAALRGGAPPPPPPRAGGWSAGGRGRRGAAACVSSPAPASGGGAKSLVGAGGVRVQPSALNRAPRPGPQHCRAPGAGQRAEVRTTASAAPRPARGRAQPPLPPPSRRGASSPPASLQRAALWGPTSLPSGRRRTRRRLGGVQSSSAGGNGGRSWGDVAPGPGPSH